MSLEELHAWIGENRYIRDLTCEERDEYNIAPPCDDGGTMITLTPLPPSSTPTATLTMTVTAPPPSLIPSITPTLTPIPVREAVIGEQRGELAFGEVDLWSYEGQTGEVITIRMLADDPAPDGNLGTGISEGKFVGKLVILDPANEVLFEQRGTFRKKDSIMIADVHIEAFALPEGGTYLIQASSLPAGVIPGAYTLVIEQN